MRSISMTVVGALTALLCFTGCDDKKAETPPPSMTAEPMAKKAMPVEPDSAAVAKDPAHPTAADAGTPGAMAMDSDAGSTGGAMANAGTDAGGTAAAGGDAKAEAMQIFTTRCATCHGATGKGDGAASAALNPKPRNFSDKTWQTSVTDAHIEKIIELGGPAVGKSPLMPPNPDLAGKPVVKELRAHIRSLGGN